MKNKKKFIIVIAILIITILLTILFINSNKNKYNRKIFYLDDIYYNKGKFIDVKSSDVEKLINNKASFLLFTYNNYCSMPISCESIFEKVMKKHKIDILKISFEEFKETEIYDIVKLAPTIIIFKEGKIVDYLKADSDDDLQKYQDKESFESWIKKYLYA